MPKAAAPKSTAISKWDEQMAKDAVVEAAQEAGVGVGKFFATQGGILKFAGAPIPGNQMAVIILAHKLENAYYEGKFDPDNMAPPTCFAFGEDEKTMKPYNDVVQAGQAQDSGGGCAQCPLNQFGTAETGKGKACGNRRRLALLPAGEFDAQGRLKPYGDKAFKESDLGFLKLSPTSIQAWAVFVKQLKASYNRPTYGVFVAIKLVPDAKTQFKFTFEVLDRVPDKLMGIVLERRKEALETIATPYPLTPAIAPAPKKAAQARGRAAAPAALPRGGKPKTVKAPPVVRRPAAAAPAPARGRAAAPAAGGFGGKASAPGKTKARY